MPEHSIFVTGATGLIGGEFLRLLLNTAGDRVFALVRAASNADSELRLLDRLQRAHGGPQEVPAGRRCAVSGDLSLDHMGLSAEDRRDIAGSIRTIIHCAADTSFIRDENCQRINVGGMEKLLSFARECRHNPLIVHISTATVCGSVHDRCVHEDFSCDPNAEHYNAYTRSKATAECMLRASGLPFIILRPSIVVSAGLRDFCFANAMMWWLPLLSQLEAVPINPAARMDMVTVSYVAQAILDVMSASERAYDCYHISAGRRDATLLGHAARFLDGYYERAEPLKLITPQEWTRDLQKQYIRTTDQRKMFLSLRHYLPFLNMNVSYDNTRLRELLGEQMPAIEPFEAYAAGLLDVMSPELMPKI